MSKLYLLANLLWNFFKLFKYFEQFTIDYITTDPKNKCQHVRTQRNNAQQKHIKRTSNTQYK